MSRIFTGRFFSDGKDITDTPEGRGIIAMMNDPSGGFLGLGRVWWNAIAADGNIYAHKASTGFIADVEQAVSDVEHAAADIIDAPGKLVSKALDVIRDNVPGAGLLIDAARKVEEFAPSMPSLRDLDVKQILSHLDWRSIVGRIQGALSTVPVIGTAASDVIATGLVIYDTLTSANALEAALHAAYEYALGSIPGLAALRWALDPAVDALVRIAGKGESVSSVALHEILMQVPDQPSFFNTTPRSIVAALAQILVAHHDAGVKDDRTKKRVGVRRRPTPLDDLQRELQRSVRRG